MLVGGQVGFPIAGFAIGPLHRIETVDELHNFLGQDRAKFSRRDHATHRKGAQLYGGFNNAHEMLEGLGGVALGPVNNAFEGFVEQLVGHVGQHQLAKERYERQGNKGCDVQQGRSYFRKGVP
ncbi:hypothetical protein D3C78_1396200 [compost metagenome]